MTTIEVSIDERILLASGISPREAESEMRLLLAAKLYELGRVTLAQAAEVAGLPTWNFIESMSRLGVSILNTTSEQLADDLRRA